MSEKPAETSAVGEAERRTGGGEGGSAHSLEPWVSAPDDRGVVYDANGDYVVCADDYDMVWQHRTGAPGNKRRALACVNACAGVPTDALEAGALGKALAVLSAAWKFGCFGAASPDVEALVRALGRIP